MTLPIRYNAISRRIAIKASDPGLTGLGWVIVGPDHPPEWVTSVTGDGWRPGVIVNAEDAARLWPATVRSAGVGG